MLILPTDWKCLIYHFANTCVMLLQFLVFSFYSQALCQDECMFTYGSVSMATQFFSGCKGHMMWYCFIQGAVHDWPHPGNSDLLTLAPMFCLVDSSLYFVPLHFLDFQGFNYNIGHKTEQKSKSMGLKEKAFLISVLCFRSWREKISTQFMGLQGIQLQVKIRGPKSTMNWALCL